MNTGLMQQQPEQPTEQQQQGGRPVPYNVTAQAQEPGSVEASPEEQAIYEKFVAKASLAMYDEKTMPSILQMMNEGDDPKEGVARAAATIVLRVARAAEEAGEPVPGEIKMNAAIEVVEALCEMAQVAGIKDFTEEEMEGIYYLAVDHYRVELQNSGQLDKEAADADFNAMLEADQQGQLKDMMGVEQQQEPAPEEGDDQEEGAMP